MIEENKFAFHLTAHDMHIKKVEGMKKTFHNSEKKLFDSREEAHKYISWHIGIYNKHFPAGGSRDVYDMYQLIRINKETVKNYKEMFPEKPRSSR